MNSSKNNNKNRAKVILLTAWFGPWPGWINLFIESCRWNKNITWIISTDQDKPENNPENCIFEKYTLEEYIGKISDTLKINIEKISPYKLCDLKPCFGDVHADSLSGYSHFGYCDLDVIFGDIEHFYDEKLLEKYDIISAHGARLAGHFSLLRNTERFRRLYRKVDGWETCFKDSTHSGFDEGLFGAYVWRHRFRFPHRLFGPKVLFREQQSTVESAESWPPDGSNSPRNWFWREGRLTNEAYPNRQFLYLHFMLWQSRRWRSDGSAAPWERLDRVVQVDWKTAAQNGFQISPDGFTPLPPHSDSFFGASVTP